MKRKLSNQYDSTKKIEEKVNKYSDQFVFPESIIGINDESKNNSKSKISTTHEVKKDNIIISCINQINFHMEQNKDNNYQHRGKVPKVDHNSNYSEKTQQIDFDENKYYYSDEHEEAKLIDKINKENNYQQFYMSEIKKIAYIIEFISTDVKNDEKARMKYEKKLHKLSLSRKSK